LLLVFIALAAGNIAAGVYYFKAYERDFRASAERQLSATAGLKTDDLVTWRRERLGDAGVIFRNAAFSDLAGRFLAGTADQGARDALTSWMEKLQTQYQYNLVYLLDTEKRIRISVPGQVNVASAVTIHAAAEALRTGSAAIEDFYRNEYDGKVYLAVLVPIFDGHGGGRAIGILGLRIDPEQYLYPFINRWPTPSGTAETLLVRRDGDDALFLNELRFKKDTALRLKVPLQSKDVPAVMAVLGHVGIVEGRDYRGVRTVAAVRPIPGSPWYIVAKVDRAEVYAPLQERLRMLVLVVFAMILASGAMVGFLWRRESLRFYRGRAAAAEAIIVKDQEIQSSIKTIREERENFASLAGNAFDGILIANPAQGHSYVNRRAAEITGYSEEELMGLNLQKLAHPDEVPILAERLRKRLAGEDVVRQYKTRIISKSGVTVPIEVAASSTVWQGQRAVMLVIRDITERVHTENLLSLNAQRTQNLLKLHEMIGTVEPDVLDFTLEASVQATLSTFSFIGFMDDAESVMTIHRWSRTAMAQCSMD
ncbi:MAG: PAS domain S-box protein, partial [Myxococcota bacterium]